VNERFVTPVSEFVALFTRAAKLMRASADTAMKRHGVRVGQNLVLEALAEEDGLTPGELAERLHVTTPTIVKTAGRMAAAGLLDKRRDSVDGRLVRLHLTERGRAVLAPIADARLGLQERATAGLTAAEMRDLERALATIIRNLEQAAPADEDPGTWQ
jgi:MarR family transcriptional regulator, organic hydroperoxide resistance regulator